MPVIIIREEQQTESGFNAFLIINSQEYSITISDPFQPQDEKILEWYFEGWLVTPMLHTETAKNAADSVEHYGLSLFEQVFKSDFNAYSNYCQLRVNLKEVQFEIQSKTPEFQSLHWEGMKDPELPRPLVELIDQGNLRVNL
ncbi:MAG TPA: Tfp pilus assembly protein PilF, partial [Cyanothece sp. UBA12306]|nr:Tfp pilus assembly protein PilF [Cyanothece sp. UBA12306]